MSDYATMLARIKALLDDVPGIGQTYDYFRNVTDITTQKTLFTSSSKLHVWFITRSAVDPAERYLNKQVKRTHLFDIWGYYAVDDSNASEKTFQALCETIQDKFDDIAHWELVTSVTMNTPTQILEITHVEWCNTLCHRAHIRITAEEEKTAKGITDFLVREELDYIITE